MTTPGSLDGKRETRAEALFKEQELETFCRVDKIFIGLMLAQWLMGIFLAVYVSPYTWEGKVRSIHVHVPVAVFLGGALSLFPIALAKFLPGKALTRHAMAFAQMMWSALLIHLTGGRIETHFHVFGSLAFLAFYMDWKVIVTATVVVAADHFVRGIYWPESVYGITNPEWWRFLEHAGWVVFEDIVLLMSCHAAITGLKMSVQRKAKLETLMEANEFKAAALEMALSEIQNPGRPTV